MSGLRAGISETPRPQAQRALSVSDRATGSRLRSAAGFLFAICAIAALGAGALYSSAIARESVESRLRSNELLESIADKTKQEIDSLANLLVSHTKLLARLYGTRTVGLSHTTGTAEFVIEILNEVQSFGVVRIGSVGGEALIVESDEGAQTRIGTTQGTRSLSWSDANDPLVTIGRDDSYDPRTKNWYLGALVERDVFWSMSTRSDRSTVDASVPALDSNGRLVGVVSMGISRTGLAKAFARSADPDLVTLRITGMAGEIIFEQDPDPANDLFALSTYRILGGAGAPHRPEWRLELSIARPDAVGMWAIVTASLLGLAILASVGAAAAVGSMHQRSLVNLKPQLVRRMDPRLAKVIKAVKDLVTDTQTFDLAEVAAEVFHAGAKAFDKRLSFGVEGVNKWQAKGDHDAALRAISTLIASAAGSMEAEGKVEVVVHRSDNHGESKWCQVCGAEISDDWLCLSITCRGRRASRTDFADALRRAPYPVANGGFHRFDTYYAALEVEGLDGHITTDQSTEEVLRVTLYLCRSDVAG